jgi:hypothetical protein
MLISDLLTIIEYDMNNVIFTLGDVLLRQINGIPMGGFISAPEAQLVCIYSEVQFHAGLGVDAKYISGCRYMDDLSVYISYIHNNYESMLRVRRVVHLLNHTYDESLTLEVQTANIDQTYSYLESRIGIVGGQLSIEPNHKNYEHLLKHGKQKLFKLQRFDSFSNTKTKTAMVVGTLYRLDNNSTDECTLHKSVLKLWFELKSLKYPKKVLIQALRQIFHKKHDHKWMNMIKSLLHHRS